MTEMKQLLALLLLGCVLSVCAGEKGARKKDRCTQGWVAAEVFIEQRGCRDQSFMVAQMMQALVQNMTVNNMGHVLTNYCSTVLPKMIQCFEENIANCTADQQATLQSLIQQTGFFCEPNTPNTTNSKMTYIMTRLNDNDLANANCANNVHMDTPDTLCWNESAAAINLTRDNFNDGIRNVSLEELPTSIQTYFKTDIHCVVDWLRTNLTDCPQWRRTAVLYIYHVAMPSFLAFAMPFTTAEIDDMFGWSSAQSRREADLDDLFGWFR